ncbi:hypothetical protein [Gordonia alkanivorans]|uniref:hypothetical protein n=1 Tax=Gordonia alkanivorans TaxID=84096 RepID=UPI00244CE07E|nr:hypothetical protein [Gordonia alkanivorans]MDH3016266.1 hypothetical protein [Gordonia alkanivorans]MDH3060707.1 hypothetical protein [Gordonia alkanivorans]
MTMTTARPRRVRALAVAAAVGLALYWGGQAPATAEPSPFGVGSHSVDAPGSGGDSGGGDSSGGDSGGSGSGSGGGDSGGSDSSGSGSGSGGSGSGSGGSGSGGSDSGSGSTRSGDGDSGDGGPASGTDTGTIPDSDPGDPTGEPSGPTAENDIFPVYPDPTIQSEGSSAGEAAVPPAAVETEPAPESSSDSTPNRTSLDVDISKKPVPAQPDGPDRTGADTTPPPAADGPRPGDTALAARAADVTRSQFGRNVSPSGDPPPWAPLLKTSTPPVAVAPQPARTGAIGILTFLGINILGGGSTGAASPAPWTLLWWIRRFGTQGPVASAESPATPYTFGLVSDPDQFLTAADGPDTTGPVPQFALVGGLVFGSALLSRKRISAAVTITADGPTSTIPVPDRTHAEPVLTPAPTGILHGSLRFTDPDGNPIPTTLHGVTPTGDRTFRTASGSMFSYDAPTGAYTYTPALQARIAASAPGAPESVRFDSVMITADNGRGGTTPITVALPITSPYSLGQVTVPGCQIDEVVVGHEDVAFVTTQRGDGCTQVSVVRPKTMTVTSVPIAGSPTEPDRGVVLGPDGRAHQLTELTEFSDGTIRTSVRITRIDPTGAASTTDPILGLPADHLGFDEAGVGYLLTTWPDDDGRTYTTYLTALGLDGIASTLSRVPGADSRLILPPSGKVFVSTSDADGTRLHEAGPGGLSLVGQVFDGEGGDIWAQRGDSLYFVRHHGDPGAPVATLAIRAPDGSLNTVDGIPGRVASVVPTESAVYVVSRSPDSVHVTAAHSGGRRWSVVLPGTSDSDAVAGPDDHLYLPLANTLTGENTVVGISPNGESRVMTAGIGQAWVRADESGTVFLTATTLTPDGEDITTVTVICGDGTTGDTRVDGTPVSVHFDRHGAAHLPMLTTDPASGDPLISLAVVHPDSATAVSAPVVGEPAGPPAIAHDGRTYLPLTRFCPETRWPKTTLVVFHPDGPAVEAGEFYGHSTHGPVLTLDDDVILLTGDAGATTIRPLQMANGGGRHAADPAAAMVFDVTPTIDDVDPDTGTVSGSVADAACASCALSYLTTDTQVALDSGSGTFVFTPTEDQRRATPGPTTHDFAVLVSDEHGSSTVISVSIPLVPVGSLETIEETALQQSTPERAT